MSDLGSPDITDLILDEHAEFRGQFVALWDLRPSGEADDIAAAWQPLADLLEVHASAEEEILYPVLLKRGGDEAPEETDDAIRDHNEIRDAIRGRGRRDPGQRRVVGSRPGVSEGERRSPRRGGARRHPRLPRAQRRGVAQRVGGPVGRVPRRASRRSGRLRRRRRPRRVHRRALVTQAVDLLTEIRAALDGVDPLLEGRVVDIEMARLRVVTDPTLFRRVLGRLIGAAVAQTEPGELHHRARRPQREDGADRGRQRRQPRRPGDLADVTAEAEEFRVIGGEIGATEGVDGPRPTG